MFPSKETLVASITLTPDELREIIDIGDEGYIELVPGVTNKIICPVSITMSGDANIGVFDPSVSDAHVYIGYNTADDEGIGMMTFLSYPDEYSMPEAFFASALNNQGGGVIVGKAFCQIDSNQMDATKGLGLAIGRDGGLKGRIATIDFPAGTITATLGQTGIIADPGATGNTTGIYADIEVTGVSGGYLTELTLTFANATSSEVWKPNLAPLGEGAIGLWINGSYQDDIDVIAYDNTGSVTIKLVYTLI